MTNKVLLSSCHPSTMFFMTLPDHATLATIASDFVKNIKSTLVFPLLEMLFQTSSQQTPSCPQDSAQRASSRWDLTDHWNLPLICKPQPLYLLYVCSQSVFFKPAATAPPEKLFCHRNHLHPVHIYWIRNSGVEDSNLCFYKPWRWFCCTLRFETPCPIVTM